MFLNIMTNDFPADNLTEADKLMVVIVGLGVPIILGFCCLVNGYITTQGESSTTISADDYFVG